MKGDCHRSFWIGRRQQGNNLLWDMEEGVSDGWLCLDGRGGDITAWAGHGNSTSCLGKRKYAVCLREDAERDTEKALVT